MPLTAPVHLRGAILRRGDRVRSKTVHYPSGSSTNR